MGDVPIAKKTAEAPARAPSPSLRYVLGVLAPVRRREFRQRGLIDLVRRDHGNAQRRRRQQGRRPLAALEQRPLAKQRAGADLGDHVAVDLDVNDAVQEQEELAALVALLHKRIALLDLAARELLALAHDRRGPLALELGLDGG